MLIAQVQFSPWDKIYSFFVPEILDVKKGSYVIVETELGLELAKIVSLTEKDISESDLEKLKPVKRLAKASDVERLLDKQKKDETLSVCRDFIAKRNLDMKLIDVHFSFEGNRINFAFISNGRVDFRDLVKDLISYFNAQIRLTQIGTRDEARFNGDCGACGKVLCCRGFVNDFSSVTSDMAEVQQVVHRGSDRISGMCGRLMCCLAFEYEGYKELAGNLPAIGTKVNVDGSRGIIVGQNILKQTVNVRFHGNKEGDRDYFLEVDINRHKKNKN